MIFIDFDDVIFNTKKFKEDLKKIFAEFGISEEIYETTYHNTNEEGVINIYDPRSQVKRISEVQEIKEREMLKSIDDFMKDCSQYVFNDVPEFIEKNDNHDTQILSYGNLSFQKEKIKSSKIDKVIGKILITNKLKAEVIRKILEGKIDKEIFFLDDRIEQIYDVKSKFPEIITILIKRPEGRYQEMQMEKCCDYQARNLTEAAQIIEKYKKQ